MSVFISHRTADNVTARTIYDYLTGESIKCYIDELDPTITPANVTKAILTGLGNCTHLIAVISHDTAGSWWVPFEIGVATDKEDRIASYNTQAVKLPEYLSMWPIMSGFADLGKFVYYYKNDGKPLMEKSMVREAQAASIQTPADFHYQLKKCLGQI